jgi:hypothetical protein
MTWGTFASLLAGLALVIFFVSAYWSGHISSIRMRQAYETYRGRHTTYTISDERIMATTRYGQSSIPWTAVDRGMELQTVYVLAVGFSYICIAKRQIPPANADDFVRHLRTHRLLKSA